MTLEQIHDIVHGLSSNQRNHFSRFVGKEGKKNKYWVLYQRLKDTKVLTSQVAKRIRGKEFTNTDTFNQYRIILADKIVQSVASQQKEVENSKSYVEAALSLGIFELAKKSLFSQMGRAFEKQEYFYLQAHYERLREIRRTFKVDWTIPAGLPEMAEVRKVCNNIGILEDLTTRVVNGLQNGEGFVVSPDLLAGVEEMELGTDVERYLYMGLMRSISISQEDYREASSRQEKLVASILSDEFSCEFILQVREIVTLIKLSLILGNERLAFRYNSILGCQIPRGSSETEYYSLIRLETNLAIGASTLNKEVISNILDEIFELEASIDLMRQIYLQFFSALLLFYNNDFQTSKKVLSQIRNQYSKSQLKGYYWSVEVVFLLCHFELNTDDILDRGISNSERSFKKIQNEYPLKIIQILKELRRNHSDNRSILEKGLSEIEMLRTNPAENKLFNFFDFSIWLNYKLEKGKMSSIAKARRLNIEWKDLKDVKIA